jgi:hypothetical protein
MTRPEQAQTFPITVTAIMRSRDFAAGVADVRAGRAPRFDAVFADSWNYERGRQWAVAAPKTMPVKIGRAINPAAIAIFETAKIP